jgi:hypothetical protein
VTANATAITLSTIAYFRRVIVEVAEAGDRYAAAQMRQLDSERLCEHLFAARLQSRQIGNVQDGKDAIRNCCGYNHRRASHAPEQDEYAHGKLLDCSAR